jgi:hypothetical protein
MTEPGSNEQLELGLHHPFVSLAHQLILDVHELNHIFTCQMQDQNLTDFKIQLPLAETLGLSSNEAILQVHVPSSYPTDAPHLHLTVCP